MTVSVLPKSAQAPASPARPATSHDAMRAQLDQDIAALLTAADLPSPLLDACRYVMTASGKRVRPLMVFSTFASIDSSAHAEQDPAESRYDMARRAALAVELLHTYSLVHDDLPCMDDDALRRGQPTCHIVFDEATALLAGDVLQTLAFEALHAELPTFRPSDALIASRLSAVFAPRARRMVSGQMLDLNAEASSSIVQSELEAIHRDKTGALIEAAILMGGICAGASDAQQAALIEAAKAIGLAFQVQDDILDVTMSTDDLGKPAGSDEKLDKSTYVKLMGVETATEYAESLFATGRAAASTISKDSDAAQPLVTLIDWLWARKK
ncbi:polyprenyl synthetase family protein [Psychrobacter aestuarii]|uniref:Polyprenyl synthetase family protein n=1 Tax=Psychrobacter aestuarii TaxID=556327 RepID=A0ABN0VSJ1_9GAMM